MKIAEIAFKVKPGSQMYKNFFIQEEEETKFLALAFRFIDKYFGKECDHSFKIAPQLSVSMSSEEHEKFKPQLLKKVDVSGTRTIWTFRQKSDMNKKWQDEVCKHISEKRLYANRWWHFDFPGYGRKSVTMWDDGCGNVYGYYYAENANIDEEALPKDIELIKLSQYYAAKENFENIGKKVEPAMKGYLANSKSCIYTVGYTDAEGKIQEIQFEISHECAYGTAVRKLIGKFNEFCKENNLTLDSLTYVKRADSNE